MPSSPPTCLFKRPEVPGDEDDWHVRPVGRDALLKIEPVEVRQGHVEHQAARNPERGLGEKLPPRRKRPRLPAHPAWRAASRAGPSRRRTRQRARAECVTVLVLLTPSVRSQTQRPRRERTEYVRPSGSGCDSDATLTLGSFQRGRPRAAIDACTCTARTRAPRRFRTTRSHAS